MLSLKVVFCLLMLLLQVHMIQARVWLSQSLLFLLNGCELQVSLVLVVCFSTCILRAQLNKTEEKEILIHREEIIKYRIKFRWSLSLSGVAIC